MCREGIYTTEYRERERRQREREREGFGTEHYWNQLCGAVERGGEGLGTLTDSPRIYNIYMPIMAGYGTGVFGTPYGLRT